MEIYINGRRITESVEIMRCVFRDVAGEHADALEIEFEHPQTWSRWRIEPDTKVVAALDGYTTGTLYAGATEYADGFYRLHANALPMSARRKAYAVYQNATLREIMDRCAGECGMGWRIYGLDEGIVFPYLIRKNEGCAAFLRRVLYREGAILKAAEGRLCAIHIDYAQRMEVQQRITVTEATEGAEYLRNTGAELRRLELISPYARAYAMDADARSGITKVEACFAADNGEAGRWARGLLLSRNRESDVMRLDMEFNPGLTALTHIQISGSTEANGDYLIDEVEHDMVERRTQAKMLRCRYGVM